MDHNVSTDVNKKIPLEELSREDLLQKCKNLLTIAQKAKQTKDLLVEENNQLKIRLNKDSLSINGATQEIIESLTEQKLQLVSTVEDLKHQNLVLSAKLKKSADEFNIIESKLVSADNENTSYKRQISRLTEENDQLLKHLESLEKQIEELKVIGLEQQEQLLILEENNKHLEENTDKSTDDKIRELQNMLSRSLEEVQIMQQKNEIITHKIESCNQELVGKIEENNKLNVQIKELSELNQKLIKDAANCVTLETTNAKLKDRLKFYHSKLVKFAVNVKQLKEDKASILVQFKEYTDQVQDWKNKLEYASQNWIKLIDNLEHSNSQLLQENNHLKENNAKAIEQLEAHKTDDEKSKGLEDVENLRISNKELTEEVEKLRKCIQELESSTRNKFVNEAENLYKAELKELSDKNEVLQREIDDCKLQYKELQIDLQKANEVIKGFESDAALLEKVQLEVSKYKDEYDKSVKEITNLKELNEKCNHWEDKYKTDVADLSKKVSELKKELEHSLKTEQQLAEKSGQEIVKLVQEIKKLEEENTKLRDEIAELNRKPQYLNMDTQTDDDLLPATELEEKILHLKRENAELLSEMNEMNQALKERGETISKLQAHCDEIMKKLQIYEAQANKNVNNITEKEEIIRGLERELTQLKSSINNETEKDKEIAQLKLEVDALKEKLSGSGDNYAESETMSTSTISKADEMNRLKDLEGSWEERYGKLRNFALKLKYKIKEMTNELANEQKEKLESQQKLANNIKIIQNLQNKCDELEDDLIKTSSESKQYQQKLENLAVSIAKDKEQLALNDEIISGLRIEVEELKNEKSGVENWKKQIGAKVQTLRKELEANALVKKELEAKITKLNSDLEAKEAAFKAEADSHRQTRNSLQQSNNENKKNCVLNLEMQDYEKSVKELTQKLDKKQETINKLKSQIDGQKELINTLKDDNRVLEEKLTNVQEELSSTISETLVFKKKLTEVESAISIKENKIENLTQALEEEKSKNEELSTELSKSISEHQKVAASFKNERDALRAENINLKHNSREIQETLKLKEDELKSICLEFDNYKVRAQSVLRQNNNRDRSLEEKLSEEVAASKAQADVLSSELNAHVATIAQVSKENEMLKIERETLNSKYDELVSNMDVLRKQYDHLLDKYNQTVCDHNETVRSLKVHAETLSQCYRQQISDQEARHNREIIELQSKIVKVPSPSELSIPNPPNMPREEGEGSESVDSSNIVGNQPISLEQLLSSDSDQEMAFLKKLLREQESKVVHLTDLLSDTEQDLVKHVQMNKLLKEEIRRQQRTVEREKHAENLEYLKNVVLKFITLNSGDERSRLVPVMNTILKLSPEETQKLNMVAKNDPSAKGWANYLPIWPSPSKP